MSKAMEAAEKWATTPERMLTRNRLKPVIQNDVEAFLAGAAWSDLRLEIAVKAMWRACDQHQSVTCNQRIEWLQEALRAIEGTR